MHVKDYRVAEMRIENKNDKMVRLISLLPILIAHCNNGEFIDKLVSSYMNNLFPEQEEQLENGVYYFLFDYSWFKILYSYLSPGLLNDYSKVCCDLEKLFGCPITELKDTMAIFEINTSHMAYVLICEEHCYYNQLF